MKILFGSPHPKRYRFLFQLKIIQNLRRINLCFQLFLNSISSLRILDYSGINLRNKHTFSVMIKFFNYPFEWNCYLRMPNKSLPFFEVLFVPEALQKTNTISSLNALSTHNESTNFSSALRSYFLPLPASS